jgi:hypothetical protein
LVIGIIIANGMVIQGAKDAGEHISKVSDAVVIQATTVISVIETVENQTNTVRDGLLQYNHSAFTELDRLKNVVTEAKSEIFTIVSEGKNWTGPHRAYTFSVFLNLSLEIDSTLFRAKGYAETATGYTNSLNLENNTKVQFVSKLMRMLSDMLVEIEKNEEMVTSLGDVGVGAANKYGKSNETVVLDLSVIFDFAKKMRSMLSALENVMANGRLFSIKAALPSTEDSAVAMVKYVAETGDNVTKLMDSQFNRVFDSAIGQIEILQNKLDLYTETLFMKNCDELLENLMLMREKMLNIKTTADGAGVKLQAAFMAPGAAIGIFGIIIAILVEIFAIVARMKRRKGYTKSAQLLCQNVLYLIVFIAVDAYVIVSFLLALVFMFIAALQFSLVMICQIDIDMCTVVRFKLTPAVKLMVVGVIMNTFMSYHLIGAMQGTWARFIGGLRHCCGNALAHDAANFDVDGSGTTGHVDCQKAKNGVINAKAFLGPGKRDII